MARAELPDEQSPSSVVMGVLRELVLEEEVTESASGTESEPVRASFEFEPNKKGGSYSTFQSSNL